MTGYLVLQNGDVFEGEAVGLRGDVVGEVVFTTGMTGYLETLSDPSYYGQMVVQTFPLIGNYGMIPEDLESPGFPLSAYIVQQLCRSPSNFRSGGAVGAFLERAGIPVLSGVDTRTITRTIREAGVMNGVLTADPSNIDRAALQQYRVADAVAAVTGQEVTRYGTDGRYRVVLWDFGAKGNIPRELQKRGCEVISVPAGTTAADILAYKPHGVMLSNGPGDPAENVGIIRELAVLMGSGVPLFGICLGHQLMALAAGGQTQKLKYGHRGANHPVRELATGRVAITSQNHGYTVIAQSLDPSVGRESHQNANDGSCEGIQYTAFPGFSVQFHPEAAAGPRDTVTLFDRFVGMMEVQSHAAE